MSSCCCQYECSCGKLPTTTSTTTTTTLCPDAIPCDSVIDLNCVVYSGCNDDCPQVHTGDSLTQVFLNLFEMVVDVCGAEITTTTTAEPGPVELVEICLSYVSAGGCSAACASDCVTYYVYSDCYNYIMTNNAFNILGCTVYTDILGVYPAADGWYSRPGGLCYILGSSYNNGEITGVTSCP